MNIKKKLDENDLVRKWPKQFRDALKFTNHDLGTLDVIRLGKTEITKKDLRQMEKFGYIFDGIDVSPYVDDTIKKQIDILTLVAFRRYQAPKLENAGRSDKKVLKRTSPQQTGIDAGACDSVCCGDSVGPDNHQGDDMSL